MSYGFRGLGGRQLSASRFGTSHLRELVNDNLRVGAIHNMQVWLNLNPTARAMYGTERETRARLGLPPLTDDVPLIPTRPDPVVETRPFAFPHRRALGVELGPTSSARDTFAFRGARPSWSRRGSARRLSTAPNGVGWIPIAIAAANAAKGLYEQKRAKDKAAREQSRQEKAAKKASKLAKRQDQEQQTAEAAASAEVRKYLIPAGVIAAGALALILLRGRR